MTATSEILASLKPLLPSRWVLLPYVKDVGDIDRTTVMVQPSDFARAPEAPLSHRDVTVKLAVINPSQDDEKAPGLLYDELLALSYALDKASLRWDTFTFAADESGHWGWTTNITYSIQKED